MFYNCSKLAAIDMGGFDLSKVKAKDEYGNAYTPFRKCPNLKLLKTPKKNTIARDLPVTLYDQTGKSYTKLPVTSKSLLLARPKQLAKGTMIVGDGVTASIDSSGAVSFYSDNGTLWNEWRSYPVLEDTTSFKVAYGTVYLPADSSYIFSNLQKLVSADFTHFNTSKVTDMGSMFANDIMLQSLDLRAFNTSKVNEIGAMFYRCFNLKILDLSSFDLSKIQSTSEYPPTFLTYNSCGLYVLKTPKNDKVSSPISTLYSSAGKAYSTIPNLSKSIVLAISKQLAKDCETYGKLFTDVLDPKHPYYKAIYWAAQKGITKGYSDGSFGIDLPCTRGHAVMFLWRMAGCPAPKAVSKSPFSDVPTTHTFYKAVLWAQQKGITKGYTTGPNKGKFGINDTCTRGQIMMFIWRYKGQPKPKPVSKTPFSDVPMNHPFYQAILWGSQKGVTNGYTTGPNKGKFGVNDNCTRGQIVTFLYRIR
jgi:surface protein